MRTLALNQQSNQSDKARWRGRWGTILSGFFYGRNVERISRKSRNGLRPNLERRQSRLTRIIREPCGGEWARVEIGRFVGFVEKR